MLAIRTVLCPVDFSPATTRQIDLAVDVCRAFGAQLVLHHNISDVSVGAGVGWMWHADHPGALSSSADAQMRALIARLPTDIAVDACITRGSTDEGVLRVGQAAEADLIVLSEHVGKTDDHAPVIERLLEHSTCAVLAMHDTGDVNSLAFRPAANGADAWQPVLVPVRLGKPVHPQIDCAAELARTLPLRLHLLEVVESRLKAGEPRSGEIPYRTLEDLIPPDLAGRVCIQVEHGDPVPTIIDIAGRISAACIVMGEHTRVPIKRWLTHDTARAVLHRAPCPVWYVPSAVPAVQPWLSRFALSSEKSILWGNV